MKYTKELLVANIKDVYSFASLLKKLGKAPVGGNVTYIKFKCDSLGVDYSHFTGQGHRKGNCYPIKSTKDILIYVDDEYAYRSKRQHLKRAMIDSGVDYKCLECGVSNIWNNINLVLHIDHIDGDYRNNTLQNLRFLCPNCHSQTPTYNRKKDNISDDDIIQYIIDGVYITIDDISEHFGYSKSNMRFKNRVKLLFQQLNISIPKYQRLKSERDTKFCICGVKLLHKQSKYCSQICSKKYSRVVDRPTKEQLIVDIDNMSFCAIGRKYGVSDNSVRKWCKFYNISKSS